MEHVGPVPKWSDQRRRRDKGGPLVTTAPGAAEVPVPRPNSQWHPIAERWFVVLAESGQSQFYGPSDWATAETMSRDSGRVVISVNEKTSKTITASMSIIGAQLSTYLKAMSSLLVTEGDRRRARVELQRPDPHGEGEEAGDVSWIDEAHRRLPRASSHGFKQPASQRDDKRER